MVKAVTIFLILIVVVAMFGRLGWLGRQVGISRKRKLNCPRCGRYRIGKGPCDCTKGKG